MSDIIINKPFKCAPDAGPQDIVYRIIMADAALDMTEILLEKVINDDVWTTKQKHPLSLVRRIFDAGDFIYIDDAAFTTDGIRDNRDLI